MFARPGFPSFDYVRATTADEAVALLTDNGAAARLMMGGTDLFPGLRDGLHRPRVVIDVKQVPGMRDIVYDEDGGLTVGAATTMNQIALHPEVRSRHPVLAEAAQTVASYQVRNRATLGGNLCNASPCADSTPATLVLEAQVVLYGPSGERLVPAAGFMTGPGQTVLEPGELMTAIRIPPAPPGAAARYLKLGRCKAGDLALVGVAVLGDRNGAASGYGFRIGLGSVAPTALRVPEAEAFLSSHEPGEEAFGRAAELARAAASPITDVRGSAEYQKAMVRTLTQRALRDVWAQLQEAD